jgi:hypothetical protein
MTVETLIHAVVRQTTILIAQLATSRGQRAPLASVANQVFLDLVAELERQRVSRKVSADMFGMGLRTYRRKIQRLSASATERGRSLWEAVLEYLTAQTSATREDVLVRFYDDDAAQVKAVLHDLCESQLVIATTVGASTSYRAARGDELIALQAARGDQGLADLILALTFCEPPLSAPELASRTQLETNQVQRVLDGLVNDGRLEQVEQDGVARYQSTRLVIPLGATAGWEAAVFDHFKALVSTIIRRLRDEPASPQLVDRTGGSTYTISVWPGHPMADEVYSTLQRFREELSTMRDRAANINDATDAPESYDRVVIYVGQSVVAEGDDGRAQEE